jgi:hypothetical protein
MRRAGFLATLAVGVSLLGASLHGLTSMDTTLKIAAAPTTPAPPQASPEYVFDHHRGCDRDRRGFKHHGPRV